MARNVVQFQKGLSEPAFERLYGTEEQCRAIVVASRARRAIAARRTWAAAALTAVRSVHFALVFSVLGCGRLLLCPGGQEKLFQIEFVIW